VLVLSAFAGAAKELDGALLVNPWNTQEVAEAMQRAIRMPLAERRTRMHSMRERIAANSIFDWSERLLAEMRDARQRVGRFWPARPAWRESARREAAR
jgi:trehalose 6-phosphate synthase